MNNAAYIDYLEEASAMRVPNGWHVCRGGIGSSTSPPAEPGTPITSELWPMADGVAFRLTGADGTERLRASLDGRTGNDDFRQTVAAPTRAGGAPGKDSGAGWRTSGHRARTQCRLESLDRALGQLAADGQRRRRRRRRRVAHVDHVLRFAEREVVDHRPVAASACARTPDGPKTIWSPRTSGT